MAATRASRAPILSRRTAYLLLAAAIAVPILVFAVGSVNADSGLLDGPGGPLIAFSAGVLSFVSPCVLPIVPIYIANLSGASIQGGRIVADRRVTFSHALAFIGGLTFVFMLLGLSAGLLGSYFLRDNQRELEQGAGAFCVLMGILLIPSHGARSPMRSALVLLALVAVYLFISSVADIRGQRTELLILAVPMVLAWLRFAGYLPLNVFSRSFQLDVGNARSVSYSRSGLIGAAFAVGWTPCIGPILASILTLTTKTAATNADVVQGTYLLAAYSAGFAVPFLAAGLATSEVTRFYRKLTPYTPAIEVMSGLMILAVGVLLWYGKLTGLNEYFNFADFNTGL